MADLGNTGGIYYTREAEGETVARKLVEIQALDEGLWCHATTAMEGYLQQELRKLHAAVEAQPMGTPLIDVVAAVRRDNAGLYWVCRRSGDGAHGGLEGMWEYPGGAVEPGEQLRQALARELREEFPGVEPEIGAVLDSISYAQYRVTFFAVTMEEPTKLVAHSGAQWMTAAEVCALDHLPSSTIFNARHLAAHRRRVMSDKEAIKEKCCFIPCDEMAEWEVFSGAEDSTMACSDHLGHLLSDAPEHRIFPRPTGGES